MHIVKETEKIQMVAPNGVSVVLIHPDGLVEFSDTVDENIKALIEEMSNHAFYMLGPKATPEECFSLMGWKRK